VLAHRIEDAESGLRIVEMLRGTAEDVEQLAALRLAETAALRQVLQDHYEAGLVRVAVRLQVLQTVVQLVQVLAGVPGQRQRLADLAEHRRLALRVGAIAAKEDL